MLSVGGTHLGFGRTLGLAGPLLMASGPSFFQWSLAVVAGFLQRCPAILSLNRGRGVSFELSHSTLIHSLPLKLSQTFFSGFHWIFAQDLNSRDLSFSFPCCKNFHFGFTNITPFELHVFLFHHERLRAEGLWRTEEDDGWKFIPFSGWVKLAHSRTYAKPKHDGQRTR